MFKASDGKVFDHEGMGKSYESTLKPTASKPAAEAGDESVVAEHGPAQQTQIVKEPDESHTVHSTHEDGHKHKSKGHDVKSAHEHSMKMMGGEQPEEETSEEAAPEMSETEE